MLGMHVEGLEGGWLSHPFWRERFVIKSRDDLIRVRNGGTNLFIDTRQGTSPLPPKVGVAPAKSRFPNYARSSGSTPPGFDILKPIAAKFPKRVSAPPTFDLMDKRRAAAAAKRAVKIINDVFDDCRRGHPVVMPQIESVVKDIASTLEHNSVAFSSVARLKEKDGYTYTHSIAVCALMITLARETDATAKEIHNLGVAGMLHDIGKLSIDNSILCKAGPLDEAERAVIKMHPEMGHRLLAADPTVPAVALDVCLHHHERLDGTGYPFGLQGSELTIPARIAVICDVYDAMTSNRPYKKGKSPVEAITEMETLHGIIDQELLFRFMRGIGVYPIGKLVRLRSNRLGVIMPTTSVSSRAVARAFYNTYECRPQGYDDVVLEHGFKGDQVVSFEDPSQRFTENWSIVQERILAGRPLTGLF